MSNVYFLDKIKQIVKETGKKALEFYNQDFSYAEKQDFPVTKVDLGCNEFLIEKLSEFKDIGILSEESREDKSYLKQNKYFLIDPLDGTKDFVHKTGDFSIMLVLMENRRPIISMVYQPIVDELYYAVKGKGAWLEKNGKKIRLIVSKESNFSRMKLLVSKFHITDLEKKIKNKLRVGNFQQKGSAGLKMCEIAQGQAHIYISTTSKTGEWDSAPGSLIVQEAGGKVTDLFGKSLEFSKKEPYNVDGFVVSNGMRHEDIIKLYRDIL